MACGRAVHGGELHDSDYQGNAPFERWRANRCFGNFFMTRRNAGASIADSGDVPCYCALGPFFRLIRFAIENIRMPPMIPKGIR